MKILSAERPSFGLPSWLLVGCVLGAAMAAILSLGLILSNETLSNLAVEDGPVETLGAGAYGIAAVVLATAVWRFAIRRFQRIQLASIAFICLLCFGEEISWGQRIFEIETPVFWADLNSQEELNLHNLWIARAGNPDGTTKGPISRLFIAANLLVLFWLGLIFGLPLTEHYRRIRWKLSPPFGFLLPGFAAGTAMIILETVGRMLRFVGNTVQTHAINETRESLFAVLVLISACSLWNEARHQFQLIRENSGIAV